MTNKTKNIEVDKYTFPVGEVKVNVMITQEEGEYKYYVSYPEFLKPTLAVLDHIKEKVIQTMTDVKTEEEGSIRLQIIKDKFRTEIHSLIQSNLIFLDDKTKDYLLTDVSNMVLGLGRVEYLLKDDHLEEIKIDTCKKPVQVYSKKYGWMWTNITIPTEKEIENYAKRIAREVGQEITLANPLLDATLPNGDRVNAVLSPVTGTGNSITIRMFAREPWIFSDFIRNKTINSELTALLWLAMQCELNILISGGTASGKTSFLNTLMPFIPENMQVVTIEDTRELRLPEYMRWTPMKTRKAGSEGTGEITMTDLLVNALRMRPDRIVMGEVRRHEEAEILFEAMHTGHSVYATVHAETCKETIERLVNPPVSINPQMLSNVHLNVVLFRDRVKGIRRVLQIGEYIEEHNQITPNLIYLWDRKSDEIIPHEKDVKLTELIIQHTGFSKDEVKEDLEKKKTVIEWITNNNVEGVNNIGNIIKHYYLNPDKIVNAAKKNMKPEEVAEIT